MLNSRSWDACTVGTDALHTRDSDNGSSDSGRSSSTPDAQPTSHRAAARDASGLGRSPQHGDRSAYL